MVMIQHVAYAPTAALPSRGTANDTDQLELEVDNTESTLIAGHYFAAASKAKQLLDKLLYIAGTSALQVRASFVLLQAKYETHR